MRLPRHPLTVLAIFCCVLGACGSDKPAAVGSTPGIASTTSASAGAASTQPASGGSGNVDCDALKVDVADMTVNWQVVLGLSNSPSAEWATLPIGKLPKFGDQLAAITASLGGDSAAAKSLSYMSGANDIVKRGLGGDAAAQADLTAYLGTDIAANVSKQLPISLAYSNAGCK